MELNTVKLFKPLATVFAGEVVVGLGGVFLHVPIERCSLATLVPTDLTLKGRLSCVRAPVNLQVILPFERFPTRFTDEVSDS